MTTSFPVIWMTLPPFCRYGSHLNEISFSGQVLDHGFFYPCKLNTTTSSKSLTSNCSKGNTFLSLTLGFDGYPGGHKGIRVFLLDYSGMLLASLQGKLLVTGGCIVKGPGFPFRVGDDFLYRRSLLSRFTTGHQSRSIVKYSINNMIFSWFIIS